jgi:SAM-dependent methyltransferase
VSQASVRQYLRLRGLNNPAGGVYRVAARAVRERAKAHFSGRLLEIGCGNKTKQLLVGEFVREYVGLDHVGSIHDHSKVDVFASAYETTLPDASFDCVLSTAVLEHLEEPAAALREALRVLKPGGVALYTAPFFWHLHEAPRDFYRYTRFGLQHLFESAGFEVLEIAPLSSFWLTVGSHWNYYLQRWRKGLLKPLVRLAVIGNNLLFPALDRWLPRDERFSWMHLVVARRPPAGSPAG